MSEPIRVLHVITGMGSGGAESFLMNMYRNIDRTKVQFDFLLCSDENIYADELEHMGSRVYYIDKYTRHPMRNKLQTRAFLLEHAYPVVHVHANALLNVTPLIEAKKAGVPVRIMHSHSTRTAKQFLKPLHWFNRLLLHRWCTDCFACSADAGVWMFLDSFIKIHNAIDIDGFGFATENRIQMRRGLNISDHSFVLGHIGRFLPVKNHLFILQVFRTILSECPDAVLVLVGDGPLEEEIRAEARKAGIADRVRFLGVRKDVGKLLSALDAFIFPSLYEGLGIVMVEAQANGLPVFCSEAVPKEAFITDSVVHLPLESGPEEWARRILTSRRTEHDAKACLTDAGYDIHTEAKRLQDFYMMKVRS